MCKPESRARVRAKGQPGQTEALRPFGDGQSDVTDEVSSSLTPGHHPRLEVRYIVSCTSRSSTARKLWIAGLQPRQLKSSRHDCRSSRGTTRTRPPSPRRVHRQKGGTREHMQPEHLAAPRHERRARVNLLSSREREKRRERLRQKQTGRHTKEHAPTRAQHHVRLQWGQGLPPSHSRFSAARPGP